MILLYIMDATLMTALTMTLTTGFGSTTISPLSHAVEHVELYSFPLQASKHLTTVSVAIHMASMV